MRKIIKIYHNNKWTFKALIISVNNHKIPCQIFLSQCLKIKMKMRSLTIMRQLLSIQTLTFNSTHLFQSYYRKQHHLKRSSSSQIVLPLCQTLQRLHFRLLVVLEITLILNFQITIWLKFLKLIKTLNKMIFVSPKMLNHRSLKANLILRP